MLRFDEIDEEALEGTLGFTPEKKKNPRSTCIVGHLASPIVETDCAFILDNSLDIFKGCNRHTRLKKLVQKLGNVMQIEDFTEDPIGLLEGWIREEECDYGSRFALVCESLENLYIQKMDYQKPTWRENEIKKEEWVISIRDLIDRARSAAKSLEGQYKDMVKAEKVKDAICFTEIEDGMFLRHRELYAESDICILKVNPEQHIIFSTNLLLCTLDKVQGRFNLLLYAKIADIKQKYEGLSMFSHLSSVIDVFEELRPRLGSKFHDLTSGYEAYVLGWVVASDDDIGCTDLFMNQYEEFKKLFTCLNIPLDYMLRLTPRNRSINMVKMYIEISGIVKIFGYPILNADKMLEQILKYGVGDKYEVNMSLVDELEGLARREICVNYYRKHNRVPVIVDCPPELIALSRNKLPNVRFNKRYDLWKKIKFGKCFDYDYSPDQSELIKDSAAAVNQSAWSSMYDPCAFRSRYNKMPPPRAKIMHPTRVILKYLNSTPEELKKLIDDRDNGIFEKEDHICVECQKECELKAESGRAFTKQTPNQRLIQVSMEHNIAEKIFPLVPEQSMIDSEIKNVRRHLQQVKNMQGSAQFINLDLKKWCLHQRHSSNEFLGRIYDELFGMKTLFTNSHLFFNGCPIFSNNRLTPPDYDYLGQPCESNVFTRLFIGGMEGLQQKKWTHGAILLIKYVLEMCDIEGEIMGQGDNQVIVMHFQKNDTEKDAKRTRFLHLLEIHFRQIGHELKEKETWYSQHLHEYSKQRMYKGSSVSYALKKCSNLIPDINDGLFSIPSSLSTINTITEAIARADYDPDIAYLLNCLNITNYLYRKRIIGRRTTSRDILAYLNWPIDFGGINLSCYHSHAVRGNDDKVCVWLSVLDTMKHLDEGLFNTCVSKWMMAPISPAKSPLERRNLYEDIYSLNIPPHPSAEMTIKDQVVSFLKSDNVTNPAIRILYDESYSQSYESLIYDIDRIRPVFPPLGHELLKNSNSGLFLRLQGKLTSSKTLEKVVKEDTGISLIETIRDGNERMLRSLRARNKNDNSMTNLTTLNKYSCPSEQAKDLRLRSWGVDIVGTLKAPWSHQVILKPVDECTVEELNSGITVRVSGQAIDQPRQCHKIYGPLRPFVGSTTQEKVSKKATLSIQDKSSFSRSLERLGKVKSWLQKIGDERSVQICNKLIKEKECLVKCDVDSWDELGDSLVSSVTGNLFHRFKSSIDKDTAMVNCLPSITGHFEYSSNSMKRLTAGGKDHNVFFQYLYTACTQSLAMLGQMQGYFEPTYMLIFSECGCFSETPNPKLTTLSGFNVYQPLAAPLHVRSAIVPQVPLETIRHFMSALISRDIGRNIDENYRLSHQQGDITSCSREYKKELISINDMRQLDLKTVMQQTVLFSSHCRYIFDNRGNMIVCLSEDRSFMYLAELILESDLIQKIIEIFDVVTNEHGGVTSIFGLSSYISKNIGKFMLNMLENPRETRLVRFYEDDTSLWLSFFRFFIRAKRQINRGRDPQLQRMTRNINTTQNLGNLISVSGLQIQYCSMTNSSVLSSWKTSDRGDQFRTEFRVVSIGTQVLEHFKIPIHTVMEYHSLRAINAGSGSLKVPQLSFMARPLGDISSAGNKALEALIATGLASRLQEGVGTLVALAEGSGSMVALLGLAFPTLTLAFNTWMRPDISHRDVPTDTSIPAWTDLRQDLSRLVDDNPLIRGETDITNARFLNKLLKFVHNRVVRLVTMDAESLVSTNNTQFLDSPILPLARVTKAVFLVKLFHMTNLSAILNNKLSELKDYSWTLYKPVSSNPVGCEVYLVLAPSELCGPDFNYCQRIQQYLSQYLGSDMSLDRQTCSLYISLSKSICSLLKNVFPTGQLDIKHQYSTFSDKFCNLFCPSFLDLLMDIADQIHTNIDNPMCHIATRSKGTNSLLYHLIHDLTFLFIWHSQDSEDLYSKMCRIARIKVNPVIKDCRVSLGGYIQNTAPNVGDMWATWRDARMYLRDFGKMSVQCCCNAVPRIWCWNESIKRSPINMISWQVYKNLIDLSMVRDWSTYLLYRQEPQYIDLETGIKLYQSDQV